LLIGLGLSRFATRDYTASSMTAKSEPFARDHSLCFHAEVFGGPTFND